jgi:alcohol-forming fatty acyl-CoA reductase
MINQRSEVKEFFRDKTVLITGTTGFVGKVLLEKMIRCLPDIKRIYLMLRPRPNMTLSQRVQEQIFSAELFEQLFKTNPGLPEWINKTIVPIEGDLVLQNLGIKPEDRRLLVEEVQVILNSAASINFNEPLHEAL